MAWTESSRHVQIWWPGSTPPFKLKKKARFDKDCGVQSRLKIRSHFPGPGVPVVVVALGASIRKFTWGPMALSASIRKFTWDPMALGASTRKFT